MKRSRSRRADGSAFSHNHQTATGMAAKDGDRALAQAGLAQALYDGRGELFGRFPRSGDL